VFELTGKHGGWDRYREFLSLQSTIAKLIWPSMLRRLRSRSSFESQLQTEQQKRAWRSFVDRPLGEVIEQYADHGALRGLLLTDGKIGVFTHAHDPSLLQNRCFLYHVIGNETGQWRVPVGGMKSLVDSLVERCRRLGVQLLSNAAALHIDRGEPFHDVTFAAEGADRSATAQNVLVNAGPRTFARLLKHPWKASREDEGSVIKINMLLRRLPRLKAAGTSSSEAFCGSFHIDEGYEQLESSYRSASRCVIPVPAPGEVYCHTLTDGSILSDDLRQQGFHTLTLFGLDMPWRLFESDHDRRRSHVAELYLRGLNNLCDEPFEECLAIDAGGQPCIEIKTPQDLQSEIDLDQGNIFHNELSWFYGTEDQVGSWGVETEYPRIYRAGASAVRGGAVSGIPGHNAAMCILQIEP
jgi:phytoene dehydrogenase-like protein